MVILSSFILFEYCEYSDVDWAGDSIDRRSTTSYSTFVEGNLMT